MKKKKKDRLVWDDIVKKWVPQFGFKKKEVEREKNWCIPIKEGPDPNINPHEKMEEDKKERGAKNELQRLRNIARSKNVKVPTVGVITPSFKGKQCLILTHFCAFYYYFEKNGHFFIGNIYIIFFCRKHLHKLFYLCLNYFFQHSIFG